MTFSLPDSQVHPQGVGAASPIVGQKAAALPSTTSSIIDSSPTAIAPTFQTVRGDRRTRRQFPNGLTVIAESMPVDAVNLSLWVNVGSTREPDAINGMTHFLEHMVFKGTQRLALGEFEQRTESCGAVTNAATSQDYTHFYLTCAPQHFRELAPLQIDIVVNAAIPDQEFERERRVVLEEIRRSEDNLRRRIFRRVSDVGFERSPYSRPVLGPPEVIEQLTAEEMRRFHRQYYRPENITAVAVGNLPTEDLIRTVVEGFDQAWGSSPGSPDLKDAKDDTDQPPITTAPFTAPADPQWEPFTTVVRSEGEDKSLQQTRLAMVWRVPGIKAEQESYPLDVLATILARGRTARLVRELREEQGLVTHITASNLTYAHQGLFYVSALLPTENVDAVEASVRQHMEQIREGNITESELGRVKTRVANSFIFGNETPSNRAGLYGYYETLSGDMHQGLHYPAAIRQLTLDDLREAARRWLNPEAYGVVVVHPTS